MSESSFETEKEISMVTFHGINRKPKAIKDQTTGESIQSFQYNAGSQTLKVALKDTLLTSFKGLEIIYTEERLK